MGQRHWIQDRLSRSNSRVYWLAGTGPISPLDDTLGGTIGSAATLTQITGTFTGPGISFTITLQNGRTFRLHWHRGERAHTMYLTMTGATLPVPVAIVLDRF